MEANYVAFAIPLFFFLIGIEWLVARKLGKQVYRLNDSVNDLSCGILHQVVDLFVKGLALAVYTLIHHQLGFSQLDLSSPLAWVICMLAVDFIYYWFHRLSHEVNFLWAGHIVHHQSEEYNLAVALRQNALEPLLSAPFYWPLALLGFPPIMFFTCFALNTLYQFWIHTRCIGRLPWLDPWLNTPANHRVHHGRNPKYIDRNHGGILIIWDRLFGTYQREEEEPAYGITTRLASWNPLWANVHYWISLWHAASRTRGRDRLRVFTKQPGWFPEDQGGFQPPPELDPAWRNYNPPLSYAVKIYIFVQFALLIPPTFFYIFIGEQQGVPSMVLGGMMITWTVTALGGLSDHRPWAKFLERVRWLAMLPVAVFLGGLPWGVLALVLAMASWLSLNRLGIPSRVMVSQPSGAV